MSIETIVADVCRTDLLESEDYDYTHLDINDIVTDDVISKIVEGIWEVQERVLRDSIKEWEKLNVKNDT